YSCASDGEPGTGPWATKPAQNVFSPAVVSSTSSRTRSRASSPLTAPSISKTGAVAVSSASVIEALGPGAEPVFEVLRLPRPPEVALCPRRALGGLLGSRLGLGTHLGNDAVNVDGHDQPPRCWHGP